MKILNNEIKNMLAKNTLYVNMTCRRRVSKCQNNEMDGTKHLKWQAGF